MNNFSTLNKRNVRFLNFPTGETNGLLCTAIILSYLQFPPNWPLRILQDL